MEKDPDIIKNILANMFNVEPKEMKVVKIDLPPQPKAMPAPQGQQGHIVSGKFPEEQDFLNAMGAMINQDGELKALNESLHSDWSRLTALINEFSCGNNATKASMFYYAYSLISWRAKFVNDLSEHTGLPSPICEIIDLAAIDVLRDQMRRTVEKIPQERINEVLKMMSRVMAPADKKN